MRLSHSKITVLKKIIFFFLIPLSLSAQNENYSWVLSDSLLIQFYSGIPVVSHINSNFAGEAPAAISKYSSLEFYLDGFDPGTPEGLYLMHLRNKFGNIVENGDSLICFSSSTQGAIFLPDEDTSKYILLQIQSFSNYNLGIFSSFNYSVIDRIYNGGQGKVLDKNINLCNDRLSEKLQVVRHANGRDWWILIHGAGNNNFIKFLYSQGNFSGPFYQSVGSVVDTLYFGIVGQMMFNQTGDKLVFLNSYGTLDYFDFDRCSGNLTLIEQIDTSEGTSVSIPSSYYSCAFSNSGRFLYITTFPSNPRHYLYQFDMLAIPISTSKLLIYSDSIMLPSLSQLLLAPDNKIYSTNYNMSNQGVNRKLGSISFPDSLGISCGYNASQVNLGSHKLDYGLPNIPNYRLSAIDGSPCDTLGLSINELKNTVVQIFPNPMADKIFIKSQEKISSIVIIDILGRQVLNSIHSEIDVSLIPKGIYFISIQTNKTVITNKLIKE